MRELLRGHGQPGKTIRPIDEERARELTWVATLPRLNSELTPHRARHGAKNKSLMTDKSPPCQARIVLRINLAACGAAWLPRGKHRTVEGRLSRTGLPEPVGLAWWIRGWWGWRGRKVD